MDAENRRSRFSHVLLLPFLTQGHINPLLHLAKRLATHGPLTTLVVTRSILYTTQHSVAKPVAIAAISDGFDDGGFKASDSLKFYLDRFESVGSKSLSDLIESERVEGRPVDAIIYDAFLPWALDVAKRLGLASAAFFTQSCTVDAVYWHVSQGRVRLPSTEAVLLPGLPRLEPSDLPSFPGSYQANKDMVLNQFRNLEGADVVLVNTFSELEPQVIDNNNILAKCQEWENMVETYKSERNKLRAEVKDLKGIIESLTKRGADFQVDIRPEIARLTRKLRDAENDWAFHLSQNKRSFAMYQEERQMADEYWKLFQMSRGFISYALDKLIESDASCQRRGFQVSLVPGYIEYIQREVIWEKKATVTQAPNRHPEMGGFGKPLPWHMPNPPAVPPVAPRPPLPFMMPVPGASWPLPGGIKPIL